MKLKTLLEAFRSVISNLYFLRIIKDLNETQRDISIQNLRKSVSENFPDNIVLKGYSVYSQNDEDGILAHIFEKLKIEKANFFEFGVSPTENNTLLLLLKKGRGVWFDKSLTNINRILKNKKSLLIIDEFIDLKNINELLQRGLDFLQINKNDLDLLSLDLDGNDLHFVKQIIAFGVRPKIFCLEYNAKFPLPLVVSVSYNENHSYHNDDYFGCSLQCYIDLLKDDYTLLTCSLNGTNCFFVKNDFINLFTVYKPENLYTSPRYFLSPFPKGHSPSTKFLELID